MSEGNEPKKVPEEPKPKKVEAPEGEPKYTQEETDAYIKKLRTENEKYRKDFEKKLSEEKEAKSKILEEQGKYKELYEQTLKEAEATKSRIEQVEKKNALKLHLRDAEAQHPELLENLFDLNEIELDNGKIKGWDEILKPVKEKYSTEFGKTVKKGYDPSRNSNSGDLMSLEQINALSPNQLKDPKTLELVNKSLEKIG